MAQKVFDYEQAVAQVVKWGWGDVVASVPSGCRFWMVTVFDRRFYPHSYGQEFIAVPTGTQPFAWGENVYGQSEDERAPVYWQYGVLLWDEECGWRRPHFRQSPSGIWYHPMTVVEIPR